jgi:hypothetical protein
MSLIEVNEDFHTRSHAGRECRKGKKGVEEVHLELATFKVTKIRIAGTGTGTVLKDVELILVLTLLCWMRRSKVMTEGGR